MINAGFVLFGTNSASVGRSCGMDFWHFGILFEQGQGLQGTSSPNVAAPFGSQPLFLLVSLCELMNSSFALRVSVVVPRVPRFFGKLSHSVFFFPMKMVVPVCSYLPKVSVAISSHDIAKSPCLLVRLKPCLHGTN